MTAPRLEVDGLAKHFTLHMLGGTRLTAFAGVGFAVARGECLRVDGPSGAGKSSLLKCLYRTYRPSAGRMTLRSEEGTVDLAVASDLEIVGLRRRAVGYVSQFFQAIPRQSAVAVVAEPLLDLGVEPGEARRRATAMLERLQIPRALRDGYPSTFSGGERQRVNLARALVVPRELLLLDEPTASLDAGRRAVVLDLLAEVRRAGTTLVVAFHDAGRPDLVDRALTLEAA